MGNRPDPVLSEALERLGALEAKVRTLEDTVRKRRTNGSRPAPEAQRFRAEYRSQ